MAVVTQLSIPPLARTTARAFSILDFGFWISRLPVPFSVLDPQMSRLHRSCFNLYPLTFNLSSNSLRFRFPNEFMNLHPHAHLEAVAQNPLGKPARMKPAKDRRKDHFIHPGMELMSCDEVQGVAIIVFIDDHKFD